MAKVAAKRGKSTDFEKALAAHTGWPRRGPTKVLRPHGHHVRPVLRQGPMRLLRHSLPKVRELSALK